ncbi:MAG: Type 4 prepilin-like proteins leader peptide-processing enzyme [Syntrophomonadaceae bacterium]|nr:Type 4 prepilin-like proteins leader peptide-processing enzyme [Bacillota bacterium]
MLVFVLGLLVGSFLNVCICRLPRGESIVFPPSKCPSCGRRLRAAELVPVISWLWQRGNCRGCAAPVSWRYPLVELLTGIVFLLIWRQLGLTASFATSAAFFAVVIIIAFIDLEHQLIPNRLVVLLSGVAVVRQIFWPEVPLGSAVWGALAGSLLLLALAVVTKGGMGGGDVKLMLPLGFYSGLPGTLLLLLLAFISGGVVGGALLLLKIKGRKDAIPFGPFLALAALVTALAGRQILEWYLN